MYILGINAYHPDSSAVIIKNGMLIAAVEEERFRRIKHWAGFPRRAIEYCLKEANIGIEDVDHIALNRDPGTNLGRKALYLLLNTPPASLVKDRVRNMLKVGSIKDVLSKNFPASKRGISPRVHFVEHHLAHLASSFLVSRFKEAALVSIDGFGDFTSCKIGLGTDRRIRVLNEVNYPHSIGLFYTAVTQLLGFRNFGDEYKVMALAAYGKPKYLSDMEEILALKPEGAFGLNMRYFSFHRNITALEWNDTAPELPDVFSGRLIELFGFPRENGEKITPYHCDVAASLQAMYERALFHILNHAYKAAGISNLCLSGGCALNSLANGKIFDNTPFQDVYIQPAASDAGGSLGAAYYVYNHLLGGERSFTMGHAYWGPEFAEAQISEAIGSRLSSLKGRGRSVEKASDMESLCAKTAGYLAEGRIVGWFRGRMEWGPRTLGNRSILADPRKAEMKDILNERIKRRESFRPFAPSILSENLGEYFERARSDPFMITAYRIRKEKAALVPAVTNVDGTGRLQTVNREDNYPYWLLIKKFSDITGIPVLLNTSFNENEPIVCTPQEALDCFLRAGIDVLVLGDYIIR